MRQTKYWHLVQMKLKMSTEKDGPSSWTEVTVTECQYFQVVCLFVCAEGGKGIIQTIAAKYNTEEIQDTRFHFRLRNLCCLV
jgi:hypothetical protein